MQLLMVKGIISDNRTYNFYYFLSSSYDNVCQLIDYTLGVSKYIISLQ